MHIQTSDMKELMLGIGSYSCNWGSHICGLYETEKERDEIITGYLCRGFTDDDKQIFIHSEQTEEHFWNVLHSECPVCNATNENPGKLDVKDSSEIYYPDGFFDPWQMDRTINGYYDYTQLDGQSNVRAVAEMAWALGKINGVEHLFAYESRLNYFVKEKTIISLCLYNTSRISGEMLMNVLRTHPYIINGGVVTVNPLYEEPDIWLARYAPEFLNKPVS
ncbi:MAG: MEDS domain-containing protein [Spirochaetales bacterium]|nr:MEDS domain-containing protein [Spirochaetales bacterium]